MNPTIMVVDDEPLFRSITRRHLVTEGFSTVEAEDGAVALRLLATAPPPDLILLDVILPRVSGIEVLKWLQARPETQMIPVVMVSARGDAGTEAASWQAGCDWYQHKPFRYEDLLLVIRRILEVRQTVAV